MSARVRCVVVNYNAGRHLRACVEDLLAQRAPVELVVVDNASTDGSIDSLENALDPGTGARVLRDDRNRGFASACNRGSEGAETPYLAFVNPDCRLPPDAIGQLVAALEDRPGDAVAGAWVTAPDGREQRGTRRRLPTPWRALMTFSGLERLAHRWPAFAGVNLTGPPPRDTSAAEAVNGALFLVRTHDFRALGGFDTGYFLHCEDLDLFRRSADRGRGLCLVPGARASHVQGVSSRNAPVRVLWHKHRGMMRYLFAHHARGRDLGWLLPALAGLWLHFLLRLPVSLAARRSGP